MYLAAICKFSFDGQWVFFFHVQNGIIVVPVIGILPDRDSFIPAPNAAEVDAIFDAPLEMFLKVVHLHAPLSISRLSLRHFLT